MHAEVMISDEKIVILLRWSEGGEDFGSGVD